MAAVSTTAVSTKTVGTTPTTARAVVPVRARVPRSRDTGPRLGIRAAGHDRAPVAAAVTLLALLLLGSPLAGVVGGTATAAGAPGAPSTSAVAGASLHVVQPGETYWSIAERLGRTGDLRPAVDALKAANGDRPLRAGDRLVVPRAE